MRSVTATSVATRAESSENVMRVSAVNRAIKQLLEREWRDIWIEGELSDVTRAASGHIYFTLNDNEEPAQLRCVMFRSDARNSEVVWKDGENIRVFASLSLYEPRGAFQAVARRAVPAGLGAMRLLYERLRKQLMNEGLLDPARKRPLPRFPKCIGVVTSPTGAAIHDILKVAGRRSAAHIILSPCLVQGVDAPESIVAALTHLQRVPGVDVIIVGRGGGSAEDLYAFNDERVVRAIAQCVLPTVSAVGHEVDVTLADLVADVRAATPSHAAELVIPDSKAWVETLRHHERALAAAMEVYLGRARLRLQRLSVKQFQNQKVAEMRHRLQNLHMRLVRQGFRCADDAHRRLGAIRERLLQQNVQHRLNMQKQALLALIARLEQWGSRLTQVHHERLRQCMGKLSALSPLQVLSRGYAIALHAGTGKAVLSAGELKVGDVLSLRLHEGSRKVEVKE